MIWEHYPYRNEQSHLLKFKVFFVLITICVVVNTQWLEAVSYYWIPYK